jgi:LysM repeat protein
VPATPTPTPQPLTHVVQAGESLLAIAARYDLTVQAIVQANDLQNPDVVYIGQALIIPMPGAVTQPTGSPPTETVTHVVESGETLTSIASRYGVEIQAIVTANDLDSSDLIYVGQALKIPVPVEPSPTPTATP